MSIRAAWSRADRYLREHRRVYYLLLFLAPFLVTVALHVAAGDTFRDGLLGGTAFAFVFVVVSYLLESHVD